jgi:hypothetical protein
MKRTAPAALCVGHTPHDFHAPDDPVAHQLELDTRGFTPPPEPRLTAFGLLLWSGSRASSPCHGRSGLREERAPKLAADGARPPLSFDRRSSAAHNSIDPAGESPALGVVRLPR